MPQSDARLIQRVLQGDQDAFSLLVKKYQKGAHALAWRKIGDFHIAQEITQDAFLKAYQKLGTLKNHNAFVGWLYVIVARLCLDWLRKNRIPIESLDTIDSSEVNKGSYSQYVAEKQATEANEARREVVKKLLQKLPESERTVMTLHYLGEMTVKAISEFLGVSPNTVKSRLRRARNRLRKEGDVLQQNLGSFQLPDQLIENIMREVSHLSPVPVPTGKPGTPLALSAVSAVVLFLLIGVGTQHLARFQKPYNLDATSEPTVEIIDAVFIYDSPAKPAVRTQAGSSALPGKSPGAGQKPNASLVATLPVDTTEVSTPKPQWTQTGGPEGGGVQNLFITSDGDTYAGTGTDLYRLTDDRSRWSLVNANMPLNGSWQMTERDDTLYVASDTEILASMDRGETWDALGTRPEGQLIDLVITDEAPGAQANIVMYLALVNGVFRSVDAGNSWVPVSDRLVNKEIRDITAIENVLFVGTDSGLYRLNSEGWTLLSVGESQNIRAVASAEHRLYVAVGEKAVNQGVGFGLPARLISATSLALYRSTDLGDSWRRLDFIKTKTEPSSQDELTVHVAAGTSESYQKGKDGSEDSETTSTFKMVAVEESLFAMDDKGSYYSKDAGENWVTLDSNIPDIGDVSKLVSLNTNTFYRNGKSGIYRTTDAGKTWHPFSTGLVNTSVMNLVSVRNVLYANVGGELLASSNGDEVWTPVPSSLGNITNLAKFNDVLYARGIGDARVQLLRLSTEDNRLSPIPGMSFLGRSDYVDVRAGDYIKTVEEIRQLMRGLLGGFAVSNNTYYMEYEQRLFRWKTGTPEWVDTGLIDEGEFIDTANSFNNPNFIGFKIAVSGRTVYVAKLDGHLFQSFDEGDTWNDVTRELPFSFTHFKAIEFAGSAIYVATDRGVAYSSDGTHWHVTSDPEGVPIVIDELAVSGTTLYGITEQRVYQLKENSDRWKQITPEIPSPVSALDVEGNVLYVGTYGSGVLRLKLDD